MRNKNKLVRKVEQAEVNRVIPKFVKTFAVKPYLRNMLKPHYNSRNSNLDYKA